jgi:hypothetical protein
MMVRVVMVEVWEAMASSLKSKAARRDKRLSEINVVGTSGQ